MALVAKMSVSRTDLGLQQNKAKGRRQKAVPLIKLVRCLCRVIQADFKGAWPAESPTGGQGLLHLATKPLS